MHSLLQLLDPKDIPFKPRAEGIWQVARLCLDRATGEQLNVGVVFTDHQGGGITSRFLSNLSGLRCLYNDDMADDAGFLIDQAEQALGQGVRIPSGWNISLGEPLFVRGETPQSIVDSMFKRMVPLGSRENAAERLDGDDHAHTTRNVRKTVRELLSKHMHSKKAPEFWRAAPVVSAQDGGEVQIDLQIFGAGKEGDYRGSIASAWYKTHYHRSAYLDRAANAVLKAREVYPSASNIMYLLQPLDIEGFTRADMGVIQKEIDGLSWLLKKSGAKLHAFSSERAMAQNILEDMGVI
ncbi:hypothetical protein [Polaromonas glacialis]|uniref:hypothetical protein n=1 Tax=Polaromonas glacialis TaxID=866564 RepID=UPI0012EB1ABF|nr:hypothetical protein [Polaromonas glacialis]